jgi:hypothetical protein
MLEELPEMQLHPENLKIYYQITKLRVISDFIRLSNINHFLRAPWDSEIWESLIYFGKHPRLVKVKKSGFKIIRDFVF